MCLTQTTLARIVSQKCKEASQMRFAKLSATTSGVSDVKEAIKVAKNEQNLFKRKTVLFIDEIHRFNKLQQVGNVAFTVTLVLYTPFTLQAVCPAVRSFTRRQNCLPGRPISSMLFTLQRTATDWTRFFNHQ